MSEKSDDCLQHTQDGEQRKKQNNKGQRVKSSKRKKDRRKTMTYSVNNYWRHLNFITGIWYSDAAVVEQYNKRKMKNCDRAVADSVQSIPYSSPHCPCGLCWSVPGTRCWPCHHLMKSEKNTHVHTQMLRSQGHGWRIMALCPKLSLTHLLFNKQLNTLMDSSTYFTPYVKPIHAIRKILLNAWTGAQSDKRNLLQHFSLHSTAQEILHSHNLLSINWINELFSKASCSLFGLHDQRYCRDDREVWCWEGGGGWKRAC